MLKSVIFLRLEMPDTMQDSLIFHYNLKFYGDDKDNYEGVSLKRFVMQVIIAFFRQAKYLHHKQMIRTFSVISCYV